MQRNFSLFILIILWTCGIVDAQIASVNSHGGKESVKARKGLPRQLITNGEKAAADTVRSHYTITFEKKETLTSAPGTKSVLFNSSGSKLYAMNLEGMSVYEFDQPTRKVLRVFKFRPTKGKGWDYEGDSAIESYQEKPVEACFTNNDRILWVSLHNAEGIIPIMVDSFHDYPQITDSTNKHITIFYRGSARKDSFDVPLIHTGKTPKIISRTADDKYLLVSNWHSYNVSVLQLKPAEYPYAKLIGTIPVASIPRGIAVDDKNDKSYVAIMGGATLTVLNNLTWEKQGDVQVASNPRHIVIGTSGRLFVSYNRLAKIACINLETGKTLFSAATHKQPRTIALSKNKQFLFVTCYSGNMVEVFKINKTGFKKLYSIECKGKPVGVDIYEDRHKLEAWVCNYTNGTINILSFKKH
jgi:DNA-binding beta-propeller fold protein YncE